MTARLVLSCLLAGALGVAAPAGAASVSIVFDPAQSLTEGEVYAGQFDISRYLGRYEIMGATITTAGYSAPIYDRWDVTHKRYDTRVEARWISETEYVNDIWYRDRTEYFYFDSVADSMVLSAGDESASASAPSSFSQGPDTQTEPEWIGYSYDGGNEYLYYTTHHTYSGHSGDLSSSLTLDDALLLSMISTGLLNFSVAATLGQFDLQSAHLNLQLATVPAPAAFWLFGSVLAGFGGLAKHRQRRRS